MDKNAVRLLVQDNISKMSETHKQQESDSMCGKLIEILSRKDCDSIITYHAFDDEIDISKINEWWHNNWKNVLVIPQTTEAFEVPDNAIIIVPGRAFTRDGQRIGRWSGYYDKLIAQYPNSQIIGVCFRCQIFEKLPEDSWDKRMDEVVFPSINLE